MYTVNSQKKNERSFPFLHTSFFRPRGFTMVEVVMYVSILALTLVAVVTTILGVSRSYVDTQAQQRIGRAAAFSLERMTREIRFADSANTVLSTFGTHPGVLALSESNPTRATRFYIQNGVLKFEENGVYAGDLTPAKVFVSSFIVTHIQVDASSAIHIELQLDSRGKMSTTSEKFYTTTVMRGSYVQ
jgi:type II secretory pathway pseudopilin PulG